MLDKLTLRSYDVASRARTFWANEPGRARVSQCGLERAGMSESNSDVTEGASDRVSQREFRSQVPCSQLIMHDNEREIS